MKDQFYLISLPKTSRLCRVSNTVITSISLDYIAIL